MEIITVLNAVGGGVMRRSFGLWLRRMRRVL
jgi:hypothetical protein